MCRYLHKGFTYESYEASDFQAWNEKYTFLHLRGSVNYVSYFCKCNSVREVHESRPTSNRLMGLKF